MRKATFPIFCVVVAVAHFGFSLATGRLRGEHLVADLLIATVPWFGARARAFTRGGLFLALGGIIFDDQRFLLPLRGTIHTGDLRELERMLVPAPGGITWPELFANHHHVAVDVATGFAYGVYLYWVFAAAIVLFFIDERRFQQLCLAFCLSIAAGVVIYLIYPAAPPWYVMAHGLGPADPTTAVASAAGASRLDALFGISYFARLYSRNPNVFGAMPSLHVAFPLLVALTLGATGRFFRVITWGFTLLMAFAAIYLGHHWVVDVVVGAGLGAAACLAARRWAGGPRVEALDSEELLAYR